jgi:hypothetical protein
MITTDNDDVNRVIFTQKIEDAVQLKGKEVTLSFMLKRVATFLEGASLAILEINGVEVISNLNDISDSAFTKYSYTFTVSSSQTSPLTIAFTFATGDDPAFPLVATAGDLFNIAQVQLCAGSVALPFQPKSFAEELRDCQRYYENSADYGDVPAGSDVQFSYGAETNQIINIPFKVNKRAIPTVYTLSDSASGTGSSACYVIDGISNSTNGTVTAKMKSFSLLMPDGNSAKKRFGWRAESEL